MDNSVKDPVATDTQAEPEKISDKEMNFARIRQQLDRETRRADQAEQERLRAMEELEKEKSKKVAVQSEESDEDESDAEPYIDNRRFKKALSKLEQRIEQKFEKKTEQEVERRLAERDKKDFLIRLRSQYKDFDEVMSPETISKFVEKNKEQAEEILEEPDEFKRSRRAYLAIKTLGMHKKPEPGPSAQERVDANMRNPFYRPSSLSPGPQTNVGDFSEAGRKSAYEKMQELKKSINRSY